MSGELMQEHVAPDPGDVAVDLVIAVHNTTRPIGRAVESVVQGGVPLNEPGGVRVTVVCHNVGIADITAGISASLRPQVRYLHLADAIPSPAGPMNLGIRAASAPYVSVMGSDDYLEKGALRNWLKVAYHCRSDVVIAPQRHADGRKVRTPVHRVGRTRRLDPVRDRLSYRTAPLGLIRTEEIRRLGLEFTPNLTTGEDQEFSARLWFGGGRVDYAAGAGRYVVGSDARDRVTLVHRSVTETLKFAVQLVGSAWFKNRDARERRAMAAKLIRVHLFGVVENWSPPSSEWSREDREELAHVMRVILRSAEGVLEPFSRADCSLVWAILDPTSDQDRLMQLARARRIFRGVNTLLPERMRSVLDPESPVRFLPASALLR